MKTLLLHFAALPTVLALLALPVAACSTTNSVKSGGDAGPTGPATCANPGTLANADFDTCKKCTFSPDATQSSCKAPRVINACCVYLPSPQGEVTRAIGLHRYSAPGGDKTVNLGCLSNPGELGTSKMVTWKGFVRLFSSGGDSKDVKIQVYKEGKDGALGEAVGTPVITTGDDKPVKPQVEEWLKKCPTTDPPGCRFRSFEYPNVPTETPLIIKTSDATGGSQWAELYDYNIVFWNRNVTDNVVNHDPSVVAATDLNTVASAAGGFTIQPTMGLLAGEVHDCGDVRLGGAFVDTDLKHESDAFYFGENETDPLPDKSRLSQGTSTLGLFGMLNIPTGKPLRLSAVGRVNGQTTLIGTYTVQTFPGAVTALSLRGRRPWQK